MTSEVKPHLYFIWAQCSELTFSSDHFVIMFILHIILCLQGSFISSKYRVNLLHHNASVTIQLSAPFSRLDWFYRLAQICHGQAIYICFDSLFRVQVYFVQWTYHLKIYLLIKIIKKFQCYKRNFDSTSNSDEWVSNSTRPV